MLDYHVIKLDIVLDIVAIATWYVMHRSYIPSLLKSNLPVTLTFDLVGQGHILFPMTDNVCVCVYQK